MISVLLVSMALNREHLGGKDRTKNIGLVSHCAVHNDEEGDADGHDLNGKRSGKSPQAREITSF